MNELIVPPPIKWYKHSSAACAPDNTLVYCANRTLIILEKGIASEETYKTIPVTDGKSHVYSVSLNPKWGDPHRYCVTASEDKVIRLWNLATLEKVSSNRTNVDKEPLIASVFAGDDRVVSATQCGVIHIWNIHTNESKHIPNLFRFKLNITCLSSCPHAFWLIAFGLTNGDVLVADLRRGGKVLHRLRAHQGDVLGLAWCPAPVNVFPKNVRNTVRNKAVAQGAPEATVAVKGRSKGNLWTNLTHADDGEAAGEEEGGPVAEPVNDFLQDCISLREKILSSEPVQKKEVLESGGERKKLSGMRRKGKKRQGRRSLPAVDNSEEEILEDKDTDTEKPIEKSANEQELDNDKQAQLLIAEEDLKAENCVENELQIHENGSKEEVIEVLNESGLEDTEIEEIVTLEEGVGARTTELVKEETKVENLQVIEVINGSKSETDEEQIVEEHGSGDVLQKEVIPELTEEVAGVKVIDCEDAIPKTCRAEQSVEEDPRPEYLLATCGKDRTVHIWRAGTDGCMQTLFQIPKKNNRRDPNTYAWFSMCWATPQKIITSSINGDILVWSLPKPLNTQKHYTSLHYEHSSLIFNILTPSRTYTEFNWMNCSEDMPIWSFGLEGLLIASNLSSGEIDLRFSTISAVINCMAASPLDPTRLVLGQRDIHLRVWDLSSSTNKVVGMQKLKVGARVTTVAWHPRKETILAYGTEDGRVGKIDVNTTKSTKLRHCFSKIIYHVEWGPINGDTKNLGLYVVSDGKVLVYDVNESTLEPIKLEVEGFVYKFAWKPDFSCLLLNIIDGSVTILNTDLTPIKTLYFNDKSLNMSVWHPDALGQNTETSNRSNWFAAPLAKGLLIYDLDLKVVDDGNYMDCVVGKLEGHVRQPSCIAWSPWNGNHILSTSPDGLTHIWDVDAKAVISTLFDSNFSREPQVIWSTLDADLVIVAERCIRIWRVSKHAPQCDDEFLAALKKKLGVSKQQKEHEVKSITTKTVVVPEGEKKSTKHSQSVIVPSLYTANDGNFELQVGKMRALLSFNEKKDDDADPFQIFLDKERVMKLLTMSYNQNKKNSKPKSCELIALWKGTIGEYIKDAINENRVTASMISLAPMVSPKLWQDACDVYAKCLSETEGCDPFEVASFYLARHKVEEALDWLCANNLHREALALAKCRLPEDSPMFEDITDKWALYCIQIGNFELAAYCYIAMKQYEKAAKNLSRRNNLEFLELALELAEKAENKELCNFINDKIDSRGEKKCSFEEKELPSLVDIILASNKVSLENNGPENLLRVDNKEVHIVETETPD